MRMGGLVRLKFVSFYTHKWRCSAGVPKGSWTP